VTVARETRLPSDAELGQDWVDVLEAVFSHVDNVLGRKPASFSADEFAVMTEGQRAEVNPPDDTLEHLRSAAERMGGDSALEPENREAWERVQTRDSP
jgi:hypothetical protein